MPIIIIREYQFQISDPYSPGDPLDVASAQALNSFRANLLRDIVARWVTDAVEFEFARTSGNSRLLSPETLSDLQRRITAYDQLYKLRPRPAVLRESTLQTELRRCATARIEARIRQNGGDETQTIEQYDDSAIETEILLPEVQEEARRRLEAKLRAVSLDAIL